MAELRSICVYCGANTGARPEYTAAAKALGLDMAANRVRLVYGGGSIGLMGVLARTVMDHGGAVTGIIPQFLRDREVMLREVDDLIVTADMHERKRTMFERSDAFVALPGGIGTLEEVVEMMTWAQLDQHAKPVMIVNIAGFWDPLIEQFRHMMTEGFLHKAFLGNHVDLPVRFVDTVEEVIPALREAVARVPQPKLDEPVDARL
ncbi:MAG: TIGR00730 family Rossman fold protein [Bauldia sp.]